MILIMIDKSEPYLYKVNLKNFIFFDSFLNSPKWKTSGEKLASPSSTRAASAIRSMSAPETVYLISSTSH